MKPKRCKGCREAFIPERPKQSVCSGQCGAIAAIANRQKAERTADRAKKLKFRTHAQWLALAQTAFNKYIRLRDAAKPCISCSRHHEGKWNAGHYLSRAARPELRFDEANVHKQCEPCNSFLSGNLVFYRAELIRRIGLAELERLEGPQEPRKYTKDELQAIKARYTQLAKELTCLDS